MLAFRRRCGAMSFVADRRSQWMLALALCASLLVHALAVALVPHSVGAAATAAPPLELMMFETVRPTPPRPPPPPPRTPRAAKRAQPSAPAPSAAVNDSRGEVAAPVTPEAPLTFMLQPFLAPVVAPPVRAVPGPPVETTAALESEVNPPYPLEAQLEGIEGTVVLRVTIGEGGRVLLAKIESDPGYGLGEAARAAVLKARFKPALRNGQPVRTMLTWRYTFLLR